MAAILVMIMTTSSAIATAAVVLAGLVFAPIFPTSWASRSRSSSRALRQHLRHHLRHRLLGGTFVPQIVGSLSVGATIQQSLLIVAAMAAALFVIALSSGSARAGAAGQVGPSWTPQP